MYILSFEQWFLLATGLIFSAIIYNIIQVILFFVKRKRLSLSLQERLPACNVMCSISGRGEVKTTTDIKSRKQKLIKLLAKFRIPLLNLFFIFLSVIIFWKIFSPEPRVESTYPSQDQLWESYGNHVEIVFDRPIDTELLVLNMSPETSGTWKFEYVWNILPITRRVKFYPSESFWPDETIMVYVSNIANRMNPDKGNEYLLEFKSVALPKIESSSLIEESVDVPTDTEIEFELNQPDGLHNKWSLIITPEVEYEIEITDSTLMKISFPNGLAQSTEYLLQVNQIPTRYDLETKEIIEEGELNLIKELKFTTVKAPLISDFSPLSGSILPGTEIRVEFDLPMNQESVIRELEIQPEVLGTYLWDGEGKVLTISHDGLKVATSYTVTLKQGTQSATGGIFDNDIVYNFSTVGTVYVARTSPSSGATNVEVDSNIIVTFDQPVDHISAESKFVISPSVTGVFSWSGNSMTFNPNSNFGYSTAYTVTIQPEVKTIYGFDLNQPYSFSFTTKSQLVMIDIVWDGQDTSWTCNFAAAKMALSGKGVSVPENALISIATRQPAAVFNGYYIVGGGNPHKGFVEGFGTYWEPVSTAVSNFRQNMVKSGWTLAQVCNEIAKGNPIVTWGQNGWSNDRAQSWTATDGETITGFSGMHSIVIVGCLGDLSNPSHIYIKDPWRKWGSELTASEFLRRWSYFGNTGMVVY